MSSNDQSSESGRDPADDRVTFLATAPNEPVAQLWADVLRQEGIKVMLRAGGPGFGAWGSVAMMEHGVFVLSSQLAAAREVLASLSTEAESAGPDEAEPRSGWGEGEPEA